MMKKHIGALLVLIFIMCSAIPALAADEVLSDGASAPVPGELELSLSAEKLRTTVNPDEDATLELPAITGVPADEESISLSVTWHSDTDATGFQPDAYTYENGEWTCQDLVIPANAFPELGFSDMVSVWVDIEAGDGNTWTSVVNGDGAGTDTASYEYIVHGPAEEGRGELAIEGDVADLTGPRNTVLPGEDAFLTMPVVSGTPAGGDDDVVLLDAEWQNEAGETHTVPDVFEWEDGVWSSQALCIPAEELKQPENVFIIKVAPGPGNVWSEVINGEGSGTETATFEYHVYLGEPATTIVPGADSPISIGSMDEISYAQGVNALTVGTTVSEYLELLNPSLQPGQEIRVAGADETGIVATGMELQLYDSQSAEVLDTVLIVLTGDVLGTGRMSLSQVVRMAQAYTNTGEPLTGVFCLAGDWTGTGEITLTDLVREAAWYVSMLN